MNAWNFGYRKLTNLDFARLRGLSALDGASQLPDLLDEAEILEDGEAPSDLVSMYSQVEVEDVATRRRHKFVLCYPGQSEPREGYISVLSPVGFALIGLRTGAVATWHSPSGGRCEARLVCVERAAQVAS